MGFHLTPKKVLLPTEPWGMRMQWEHTTEAIFWVNQKSGSRSASRLNLNFYPVSTWVDFFLWL